MAEQIAPKTSSSNATAARRTAQPASRTKTQAYEYREILRSQITPSPYNPKEISNYSRGLLNKSLKDFGLVETLVWNETTGNWLAAISAWL